MQFGRASLSFCAFVLLSLFATNVMAQLSISNITSNVDTGGSGAARVGDTVTFYFELYNSDQFTAIIDVYVDPGNPGVTVPPGFITVPPAQFQTITGVYTLTGADLVNGVVSINNATAYGVFCPSFCEELTSQPVDYDAVLPNPSGEFVVSKNFLDGNASQFVSVSLSCTDAIIETSPLPASLNSDAIFTLSYVGINNTCTATEAPVPGYTWINPQDCQNVAGVGGGSPTSIVQSGSGSVPGWNAGAKIEADYDYACEIQNQLIPVVTTLSVTKIYTDSANIPTQMDLSCTAADIVENSQTANPTALFDLTNVSPGNTCTATETLPPGYVLQENLCVNVSVEPGMTQFCDITNEPDVPPDTTFTVSKVFSDNNTAQVLFSLSCTDATPDSASKPASMGNPAVFDLSDVGEGNQCTATETDIPGYVKDESACQSVNVGEGDNARCQISNVKESNALFTVEKIFADDNPMAVQINLSCTNASIDQASKPASMSNPAEFRLSLVGEDNQCTAREVVPDGYDPDESDCNAVAVGPESSQSCTIINALEPPADSNFTVHKVFSDGNEVEVQISASCTAAEIDESSKPASMGHPAVFVLSNVLSGNQCTATETVIPGYVPDESACANVVVGPGNPGECTITNNADTSGIDENPDRPFNQQQVADVINDSCPEGGNSSDFQALCSAMIVSDNAGYSVEDGLKQATADDAAAVRSSAMQTANIQTVAVDGRIGAIRGGGGSGFSASGFSMAYGDVSMSGSLLKSFISAFDENTPEFMQANASADDDANIVDEFGRWGAWISGRVIFGKKDATLDQREYDFDTAGLTFGMDYRFNDSLVAGVSVGYANTDVELGNTRGELDTKGYSVTLYGSWFKGDNFFLGGSIGYGDNDFELNRSVQYTLNRPDAGNPAIDALPDWAFEVDQSLGADFNGSIYSASISGGWDFNKNGWTFGPSFHIDWVTVDVNAFDEYLISSNGGSAVEIGWAAHIEKQKYESLQPAIGFSFSKAVSASWGVLVPQGYIDVIAEVRDSGVIVNGHFIGDANGEQFGLLTDDFEETFVRAGLGVGLVLKNNKSAFFMADGDFGRDLLKTYFLNAGFRWQF